MDRPRQYPEGLPSDSTLVNRMPHEEHVNDTGIPVESEDVAYDYSACLLEMETTDQSQWPYAYKDPEQMPPEHKDIARYIAILGLTPVQVAAASGMPMQNIYLLKKHPPFNLHCAVLRLRKEVEEFDLLADFDELIPQAVREMARILDDKQASDSDKIKAAKLVMERDPKGRFLAKKTTQHDHNHTMNVVDTEAQQRFTEASNRLSRQRQSRRISADEVTETTIEEKGNDRACDSGTEENGQLGEQAEQAGQGAGAGSETRPGPREVQEKGQGKDREG